MKRNQLYEENIPGREKSKYKSYEPFDIFAKVQETDVAREKCSQKKMKLERQTGKSSFT